MIQGLLAIILLVLAVGLYLWGRRSTDHPHRGEDPDVILGLTEQQEAPTAPPVAAAVAVTAKVEQQYNQSAQSAPLERIILFLRAPAGRQYGGYELLQSLLSCGLRFGENDIFHRYEQHPDGQIILFSIAAATKTGALNPADMGDFTCSGLSLFLTLNQHVYPSVNFELMLDTVRQLAEDLSGNILDEKQSPLTQDKVQQIREKIKQFETSQQTMELFV